MLICDEEGKIQDHPEGGSVQKKIQTDSLYGEFTKIETWEGGLVEGRLWWEQTADYWELPFYSECGVHPPADRSDWLAAREQLWALREGLLDVEPGRVEEVDLEQLEAIRRDETRGLV